MKFEHTRVMNFEGAIRGMRNPKDSWHLSDSCLEGEIFKIGPKDLKLAQNLIRGGSEHRKFMRQIFVCVDITASIRFFKEFDTYKVGTTANSTSTMHTLHKKPITVDSFEQSLSLSSTFVNETIPHLEELRQQYLETEDKKIWETLTSELPMSWLQTRTVTMTYENLLAMCGKGQRRFHKLTEWSIDFIEWARSLPYAQELIFLDELETKEDKFKQFLSSVGIKHKDRDAATILNDLLYYMDDLNLE